MCLVQAEIVAEVTVRILSAAGIFGIIILHLSNRFNGFDQFHFNGQFFIGITLCAAEYVEHNCIARFFAFQNGADIVISSNIVSVNSGDNIVGNQTAACGRSSGFDAGNDQTLRRII